MARARGIQESVVRIVYQQISGRSPLGLPAWQEMTVARARLLQEAAQEANERFGRR